MLGPGASRAGHHPDAGAGDVATRTRRSVAHPPRDRVRVAGRGRHRSVHRSFVTNAVLAGPDGPKELMQWACPFGPTLTGTARSARSDRSARAARPRTSATAIGGKQGTLLLQDPDVGVRRLLADDRRNHPGDAADVHLQHVVQRLSTRHRRSRGVAAGCRDLQFHQARLRRGLPPSTASRWTPREGS